CNRRARPGTEGFACDTHGVVSPAYGCVLNAMFDDGTGSIRLVLFRQQAAQLLKKDDAGLEAFREAPEDFIPLKQELIGSIIKARGRVNRNKLYDRLEVITDFVDPTPNPEEELKIIAELEAQLKERHGTS
ncbi:hypothetical protein COV94_02340, partial [Candidatus Woesearchaeota archaeon CG11_big_fil_rev_8_21_14_0_20_57_5]